MRNEYRTPSWYDKTKLRLVRFDKDEIGWVVDLGDGTCRLANDPLTGGLRWGDRVALVDVDQGGAIDRKKVVERYNPEDDRVPEPSKEEPLGAKEDDE